MPPRDHTTPPAPTSAASTPPWASISPTGPRSKPPCAASLTPRLTAVVTASRHAASTSTRARGTATAVTQAAGPTTPPFDSDTIRDQRSISWSASDSSNGAAGRRRVAADQERSERPQPRATPASAPTSRRVRGRSCAAGAHRSALQPRLLQRLAQRAVVDREHDSGVRARYRRRSHHDPRPRRARRPRRPAPLPSRGVEPHEPRCSRRPAPSDSSYLTRPRSRRSRSSSSRASPTCSPPVA